MPASAAVFVQNSPKTPVVSTLNDPLAPYVPTPDKPWNARRVAHLYRRLGFGATHAQIQQGLLMTPSALVDSLLDTAAALPPPVPPVWGNWLYSQYGNNTALVFQHIKELKRRWLADMLGEGIRAKMAFFWSDHFVTQLSGYMCNSWLWNYYSILHQYAFGNFKDFVLTIGKSPAMLHYLNGNLNVVGEPNENYARELMELFTMGESNGYTQNDIVNMARALTGWQADDDDCAPATFNPGKHDNGQKTIFGQTANFGFDDAHNLIFTARPDQVSRYIAEKIYKYFVYQNADSQVIDGLATTFKNSNWELLPMMKQLFKSEHFFEEQLLNARIKSPMETFVPILKMSGCIYPTQITDDWLDEVLYFAYILHEELFEPPNVSGWKEHRPWINESTLSLRWEYSAKTIDLFFQNDTALANLVQLAMDLTNQSNDPVVVTTALVEFFTGQTLDPVHLQAAVGHFKAGIPENYFLDGSWNLFWDEVPEQIINLLKYLIKLPEFQLN
ncbi:MAG: hypothetical protein OHK0019_04800 [Saprospiraceae bacterium]